MTIQQEQTDARAAAQASAPVFDPLTAAELHAVRETVLARDGFGENTRFVYVGLEEPAKADVLAHQDGTGPRPARLARALTLDLATGAEWDLVVDVADRSVAQARIIDGSAGRVPILEHEFEAVGPILAADERWREALAARGLTPEQTVAVPLSAGDYPELGHGRRRILRSFAFARTDENDNPWAHPVDGLTAYVDPVTREVVEIVEHRRYEVPEPSANFHTAEYRGPDVDFLKPIEIIQPEGPSFTLDGTRLRWGNWDLSVGFDAREGLILRQLGFFDRRRGIRRPIAYRASIAEMVVPYGDPQPTRFWQNYFDTGEYLFGRFVNPLELGCDCLGEITYLDVTLSDELGMPRTIQNAICIHEEDFGTLWKHTDMFTGSSDVRRQRRLVISFFTTVGNYDYGFYWYLYLDGTIECEAKLTGILFPSAYPGEGYEYASQVAPGVGAPYHQHLFCARIDLTIDGPGNTAYEVDAARVPMGPGNHWANAFTAKRTPITSEAAGARSADAECGRVWQVVNPATTNFVGEHPGYVLHTQPTPMLLADSSAEVASRAAFATKPVWFTAYDPAERYPAGDFVNQSPGGAGLPAYQAADRPLENADLVLWHTFGLTHFPRTEDWPVMPVDYAKFTLKPYGFFDGNPALDIPETSAAHCAPQKSTASAKGHDHHHHEHHH